MRSGRTSVRAFTLVELLVVIGIIALLISVLLPALNRARQAANLVDCQARLRQMGQLTYVYAGANKGSLPWGGIMPTQAMKDGGIGYWWWMFTLSEVGNRGTVQNGRVTNLSPVFRDKDTIESTGDVPWVSHYTANMRILYRADLPDPAPGAFGDVALAPDSYGQRKLSSVKRPAETFIIWDGPQWLDQGANSYGVSEAIDAWGYYNGPSLCVAPNTRTDLPIFPGQLGAGNTGNGKALQRTYNLDARVSFGSQGWTSHLRFRHMKNTTLAALCVDGHTETRRIGEVMRKDIYTNYR